MSSEPGGRGYPSAGRRRFLLAGTAGGVGTTSVTSLLFAALRGPRMPAVFDHTAGTLGGRLPDVEGPGGVDRSLLLHDLGPTAMTVGVAELADPGAVLVVVSAATTAGCRLAGEAVEIIKAERAEDGLRRSVLVLAAVSGRAPALPGGPSRAVSNLQALGVRRALLLAPDPSLAAGGQIPARVSRKSRQFGADLSAALVSWPE